MIEFLKNAGSFLGLITAFFFFYDRMAKGRPIGSLTVTEREGTKLVCIRLSNPSDYDLAILKATAKPKVYFLTEDQEIRSLIDGQIGDGPYFMLKPKEQKELILGAFFKDGIPLELEPQRVTFRISWRRGNATWLPQWPVHVCTNTTTIRKYGLDKSQLTGPKV